MTLIAVECRDCEKIFITDNRGGRTATRCKECMKLADDRLWEKAERLIETRCKECAKDSLGGNEDNYIDG